MATSFISFGDYGFWVNDVFMQLALNAINTEMKSNFYSKEDWIEDFRIEIEKDSRGHNYGAINIHLDKHLSDDHKKQWFLDIITNTLKRLVEREEEEENINPDEFNAFIESGLGIEINHPVDINHIINVLLWLKGLVMGVVRVKSSDFIFYRF